MHSSKRPSSDVALRIVGALAAAFLALALPFAASADAQPPLAAPNLNIPIPNVDLTAPVRDNGDITVSYLSQYISGIYTFLIGVVGVVAAVMMMIGGFQYLTAGGDAERTKAGRTRIVNALAGLTLALGSYLLLYAINPDLVKFQALKLTEIGPVPEPREESLADPNSVAGGGDSPDAHINGIGDTDSANRSSCPKLEAGTSFQGAFTTYYNLSPKQYGQAGSYAGIYKGSDPSLQGLGDFFCSVSMECGCPAGYQTTNDCSNGRKSWPSCKYFGSATKYCASNPFAYRPGDTVAASTCFPRHCTFKTSSGHVLEVTDRGSGIIGTHFDLYLGVKGEPGFVTDTSWLSSDLTIIKCDGTVSDTEKQRMYKAYNHYAPGVCVPGQNC